MLTMSSLLSNVRWGERSAISLLSLSADCTTASFTDEVMNGPGGRNTRSSRSLWRPVFGVKRGKLPRMLEQFQRIGALPKSTARVFRLVLDTSASPKIPKRSQFFTRRRNDILSADRG